MQGYVERIVERSGTGRNGPYVMYSIVVNNETLGSGFKRPDCREGDYIEYSIDQAGKYKNIKDMKVVPAGSASPQTGSAPLPVNKRDVSIHYQSCRNAALTAVDIMLRNEAVKLPAKQADKYDAFLAIVQEITNQFYVKLESVIEEGGVTLEDMIPQPEND